MAATTSLEAAGLKQQEYIKTMRRSVTQPGLNCGECIDVCVSIIEEERGHLEANTFDGETPGDRNPMLDHPLALRLLTAIERWIVQESLGADAAKEFAEIRSTAIRLIQQSK